MTAHVSDRTMTDLLDGGGAPVDWAHVASCAACRARMEEARAGWELARKGDVPEPPGMYWEALRRNVSRRIEEESARPGRWGWLAPLAATAAALLVLGVFLVQKPPARGPAPDAVPAWSALPPAEDDESLTVLTEFAADDGDWPDWEEGRGLGAFVASLSDEESEELVAALGVERPEGEL